MQTDPPPAGPDPGVKPGTKSDPESRLRRTRAGCQRRSVGVRFSGSSLFVRTAAPHPPASNPRHPTPSQHPVTDFIIKLLSAVLLLSLNLPEMLLFFLFL